MDIHYLPQGASGDYSLHYFLALDKYVTALDTARSFDIVHAQELSGLFLRRRSGRFIVTVHGTMFSEVPLYRKYFWRLTPGGRIAALWRYKTRMALYPAFCRMLARADHLLVDSDFTRRELRLLNVSRQRMSLVPLGIDFSRYPDPPAVQKKPDILTIACLGRLQRMKGLDIALEAATQLRHRRIHFRLLIGGSGEYHQELAEQISLRNLGENVQLCGRIGEGKSFAEFLSQADVFLFPDLTQPAFGLVAIEAMRYGLPVVGARSGAMPEVVTDETGWIYDPWNSTELADLLARLASNPREVNRKSSAVITYASRFTATRMAEQSIAVYQSIR